MYVKVPATPTIKHFKHSYPFFHNTSCIFRGSQQTPRRGCEFAQGTKPENERLGQGRFGPTSTRNVNISSADNDPTTTKTYTHMQLL